jgi:hypothetical protein
VNVIGRGMYNVTELLRLTEQKQINVITRHTSVVPQLRRQDATLNKEDKVERDALVIVMYKYVKELVKNAEPRALDFG